MRPNHLFMAIIFTGIFVPFCVGCSACARKTLEIRLPDDNPAWQEVKETVNSANSILRQLENNPDDIAVTLGSQDENKVKTPRETAF